MMVEFPYDLILMAVFGCAVGFIGGYAGIAGAPFLIFLLSQFLGYTQHAAQGTVLAVMMGPMTLFGVIALWDSFKPHIKYAVVGVITYAGFSYIGGTIAYIFDESKLKLLFGIVLIIISVRHFLTRKKHQTLDGKKPIIPLNLISISIIGVIVGIIGGTFGIGAGVLMVPVFVGVFRIPKDEARAITLAILLPPVSVGAVIKYHGMGDVDWIATGVIFLSFFLVNYFGAKAAKGHSTETFSLIFSIILFALGAVIIFLSLNKITGWIGL